MDCVQGSICFEMMKGVPAGVVTLVIGSIAGLITWRQYQVAKAKLKLDLFEKRYAIFQKTRITLSDVFIRGTEEDHDGIAATPPFINFMPEATFLFGPEIEKYLDELSGKWNEHHALSDEKVEMVGPDGHKNKDSEGLKKLDLWFYAQATKGVQEKFSKYLNFANWK
jgi:hypothetical protein